jgi:toxin ParE1/3/4
VKIVWSPLARDHVAQAFASIAAERPSAALRWLEDVIDKTTALGSFPDMGRMVPEVRRPSVREVLVPPYRLLYRRDETEVLILALHHARRELAGHELEP